MDDRTILTVGVGLLAYLSGIITNYVTKRREGSDAAAIEDRRAMREWQAEMVKQANEQTARVLADNAQLRVENTQLRIERDRAAALMWEAIPTAEKAGDLLSRLSGEKRS